MKRYAMILLAGATAGFPGVFLAAAEQVPKPPPTMVQVAATVNTRVAPTRWVPGSVVSRDDARVASTAAGRLMQVAEVGARVGAGERVAKLDDTALRLRLDEARAEQARARAQRDLAASQLARLVKLSPSNSVAATQLEESRAQAEIAAQDLARTEARSRAIEHDIAETEIRAAFGGVVTERFAQRGEFLQAGAAVVHLVDTENLEARVQAPLALAPNLRRGAEIAIRGPGGDQRASVRAVVPVGEEKSRQFELRVTLPKAYALVGSAVEAALPEAAADDTLAVPRDALVLRQDHTYVMRVRADNTAERIEVTTGPIHEALVAVRGPLAVGDRVVVRGAERLEAGQAVRMVEPG